MGRFQRKLFPPYQGRSRGICAVCEHSHGLTTDGLMRRHEGVRFGSECAGSLEKPASIQDIKEE